MEKTMGRREFISFPDLMVDKIKAKVDTGAYGTALHVDNIEIINDELTFTINNNKFTYTKIGNLVTVTGRLDVSAISSPNGDLYFSLPFAIAQIGSTNNTDTSGGMFVWYPVSGDSGKWVSWADAGTSVIYVRHGAGVQPPQSANLVRISTEFRMNFSYRTT